MKQKSPLIHIDSLSHTYREKPVFRDLSFDIFSGDICLISGPSGVGKTTLLSLIGGIIPPQGGSIVFDKNILPRERGFGYAFIDGPFFEMLTVRENIFLLKHFADIAIDTEHIDALMRYFEIDNLHDQKMISLSVGQRERVNFVRALAHSPAVVIFDEPGANLDARLFEKLIQYIQDTHQKITYVIVSHDARFIPIATSRIELTPL